MFKFRNTRLSGLADLRGSHAGETAVITCSGPTFAAYRDEPFPRDWSLIAVNETIKHVGSRADYWVLSDEPVVERYADHCPESVRVLAMHRAAELVPAAMPHHWVRTTVSMEEIKDYGNGYEFYSRRTVLIGAIEMARWLGFTRFFVFGLDLFRLRNSYYYDGSNALIMGERHAESRHIVPLPARWLDQRIYQTPNLRGAANALGLVKHSGLWKEVEIFCVGSPVSQQRSVPLMTIEEFREVVGKEGQSEVAVSTVECGDGKPDGSLLEESR